MKIFPINYQNPEYDPLSCLLFKIRRFGDWILSPSSGGTYSVGPNRWSQPLSPSAEYRFNSLMALQGILISSSAKRHQNLCSSFEDEICGQMRQA
jgi:hypothetical protein